RGESPGRRARVALRRSDRAGGPGSGGGGPVARPGLQRPPVARAVAARVPNRFLPPTRRLVLDDAGPGGGLRRGGTVLAQQIASPAERAHGVVGSDGPVRGVAAARRPVADSAHRDGAVPRAPVRGGRRHLPVAAGPAPAETARAAAGLHGRAPCVAHGDDALGDRVHVDPRGDVCRGTGTGLGRVPPTTDVASSDLLVGRYQLRPVPGAPAVG